MLTEVRVQSNITRKDKTAIVEQIPTHIKTILRYRMNITAEISSGEIWKL